MRAEPERYEPLPGLLELPRFLIRKLSPRGRRIAAVVGVLALAGAAVGLAIGIPAIVASKEATSKADARAKAQYRAARLAQLRRQVQPMSGSGPAAQGLAGTAALAARGELRGDLVAAIRTDSLRRARTGEFATAPRSVHCERYPLRPGAPDPATQPATAQGRYACLAVTARVRRASYTSGSMIGYPYRALVDFRRGRYTFCRISERPGEMLIGRDIHVNTPAACGG